MNKINILYIDDDLDTHTEGYLNEVYNNPIIEKNYDELLFKSENGNYESLLNDIKVKKADVIIIDSKLFQNVSVTEAKLSGEEFRIIIKKIFPYKEIIVITQNAIISGYDIISKYDSSKQQSAEAFYNGVLKERLDKAIDNILLYRRINEKLKTNKNIDAILLEKIENNLGGILDYDTLSKDDIDNLVSNFEEIKELLESE